VTPTSATTVLHTSDCHLGGGPNAREERAFVKVIDLALRSAVDAVLITGDLFDHARVGDAVLEWTADQLDRLHCPVVMLPGNHDELHANSVHHRFDAAGRCRQAVFIGEHDGEIVTVPGTEIVVWARAMQEHNPEFRPLVGVPARPEGVWAIVAGHGLVMDEGAWGRSSPIYPSDMDAIDGWDYVALGHCHAYEEVRARPVPVFYCGATASSRNGTAGAMLVSFVPGEGARPQWVPLEEAVEEPAAAVVGVAG
jgi:DNA repair exonuclease SbcCD nuclease subunit